jgi:hypothetical protein
LQILTFQDVLLEKETKRLEEELQKIQYANEMREKELAQVKAECDRLNREVRKLNGGQEGGDDGADFHTRASTPMFIPSYTMDPTTSKFLDSAFRDVRTYALCPISPLSKSTSPIAFSILFYPHII